jgi:hypothetical protein
VWLLYQHVVGSPNVREGEQGRATESAA